jgi:hypothetical protein
MHWLTVEVFDAALPATSWLRAWRDSLVETALATGAVYWDDHTHEWGVVLEFTFADEQARDRFRAHPVLTSALDAAPDPVNGALVYPHRGGGTGSRVPRRPHPPMSSGAVALPEPPQLVSLDLVGDYIPPLEPLVLSAPSPSRASTNCATSRYPARKPASQ